MGINDAEDVIDKRLVGARVLLLGRGLQRPGSRCDLGLQLRRAEAVLKCAPDFLFRGRERILPGAVFCSDLKRGDKRRVLLFIGAHPSTQQGGAGEVDELLQTPVEHRGRKRLNDLVIAFGQSVGGILPGPRDGVADGCRNGRVDERVERGRTGESTLPRGSGAPASPTPCQSAKAFLILASTATGSASPTNTRVAFSGL